VSEEGGDGEASVEGGDACHPPKKKKMVVKEGSDKKRKWL
jgi:hypothetical protein